MPKFCPHCGDELSLETGLCLSCAVNDSPDVVVKKRRARLFSPTGVKSAIWLYFIFLLSNVIFFLDLDLDDLTATFIVEIFDAVIVTLFVLSHWKYLKRYFVKLGKPVHYLIAVIGGVASFALATVLVEAASSIFDLEALSYSEDFIENGHGIFMVILCICIQPAVIEEMAFRGFMLTAFQEMMEERDAIILSALLFMIIHLMIFSFPHLIILGICLGILKVKSKSIYPCMLWHFIHNLLCVVFEYV